MALTFNWILIESDRRLTLNEIHTGHLEQPMCEGQTNGKSCSHLLTQTVRCSHLNKDTVSHGNEHAHILFIILQMNYTWEYFEDTIYSGLGHHK